jgi:hypothetical protein
MKCSICKAGMVGVVTFDPMDGKESNRLECCGPLKHTQPFTADLADVMSFRARVSQMMG